MSHIEGHVDDPPKSCGVLILGSEKSPQMGNDGKPIKLSFVPPEVTVVKGTPIGFHPIFKDKDHNDILAIDVILWKDHGPAESEIKSKVSGFDKIEEIYDDEPKQKEVEKVLGEMKPDNGEVIRKTLKYFKQIDFKEFYKKGNGKPDSANAEEKIIEVMNGKPKKSV